MRRSLRPYERDQVRGSWPRPRKDSATSQPGSPDSPATAPKPTRPPATPAIAGRSAGSSDDWPGMSTRYLIILALITGLVILAASAIQFLLAR